MARHARRENSHSNEAGFALVGLLAGIPLLLVVLVGLSVTALALKNRTTAFAECRWSAYQAQKEMGVLMKQLMSLNPKARSLRMKRKAAEVELKAAVATAIVPLIVAAQGHRAILVAQQMQLRSEQERLLLNAKALRAKAQREVQRSLAKQSGRLQNSISTSESLAVGKFPPLDLTPDHLPKPLFEKQQALQFYWQSNLFFGVPDWLLRAGNLSRLKFNGECAATIKEEGKKWVPHLVAAKSLRN